MKNSSIYIIFLVFVILSGCTTDISEKRGNPPPPDLIPRNEIVDVIADMHLYDAVMKEKQKKHRDVQKSKYYLYQTVMDKYHITREQFESSLTYYQQDLDEYNKIYDDVIEKLSKMKAEAAAETR